MTNLELTRETYNIFDLAKHIGQTLVHRCQVARATWHRDFDYGFGDYTGSDELLLAEEPVGELPAYLSSLDLEESSD